MPHPLFLFEARRASKGSVSASLRSARNVRPQDAPRPLVDVGGKKADKAFHAPSAFFVRSPSGFERFGLRFDGQVQKLS